MSQEYRTYFPLIYFIAVLANCYLFYAIVDHQRVLTLVDLIIFILGNILTYYLLKPGKCHKEEAYELSKKIFVYPPWDIAGRKVVPFGQPHKVVTAKYDPKFDAFIADDKIVVVYLVKIT